MKYLKFISRILILVYIFAGIYSLNVEDLKLLNCKVDILETPVIKGEEPSVPVVHVSSMNGQEYSCLLPQEEVDVSDNTPDEEEIIDVKEQLKSMQSKPCLRKETGWWTAELCFGRDINQYHVKDGRIASYVFSLGVYDSDTDWNNDTNQGNFTNVKQRYISQYYVNGTDCGYYGDEPSGILRKTEVRLYCEEDVQDYISSVEEPDRCTYIITVHTSSLCSNLQLKHLNTKKPNPVSCHPLLDEEQYSNYLDKLNGV